MNVSVVIVAAGKGKRLGGVDKAFIKIKGKPILFYSVEKFLSVPEVSEIVVVVNSQNESKARAFLKNSGIRFATGGKTRAESVRNGVNETSGEFVMIHDAARPFITKSLILKLIEEIKSSDAVIPVLPVKPTIKEVENGFVKRTLPREKLFTVQTPQIFKKEKLLKAYKLVPLEGATDEAMLVERIGGTVKTVRGIEENIKITTPFDLILLKSIMEKWKE